MMDRPAPQEMSEEQIKLLQQITAHPEFARLVLQHIEKAAQAGAQPQPQGKPPGAT